MSYFCFKACCVASVLQIFSTLLEAIENYMKLSERIKKSHYLYPVIFPVYKGINLKNRFIMYAISAILKSYHLVPILLFSIILTSCGGSKFSVKNFSDLSDPALLNGSYQNEDNNLSHIFRLSTDTIDSVSLKFDKDSLILICQVDSGLQSKSYKGKFKKNYFEIYLSKKISPIPVFYISPIPVFYFGWNIERVRLGRNENRGLLVQYWQDNFGWILFASAGGLEDKEYSFPRIND